MNDNHIKKSDSDAEIPTLKVVHRKTGKLEVLFPFTKVPVEMTKQYFDKNIDLNHYIIDFEDDFDHPKAG